MRDRICTLEEDVLEATRSGSMTEELSRHLATCRACSDAVSIEGLLQTEARAIPEPSRMPDPGRIWLQAKQQRLLHAADRATRPIRAVGLAVGTAMSWTTVRSWLGQAVTSIATVGGSADSVFPTNPIPIIAGTILFLVLFGLYSELVEG
jgi:predicted anti-sigma-YlaC factor YlaD